MLPPALLDMRCSELRCAPGGRSLLVRMRRMRRLCQLSMCQPKGRHPGWLCAPELAGPQCRQKHTAGGRGPGAGQMGLPGPMRFASWEMSAARLQPDSPLAGSRRLLQVRKGRPSSVPEPAGKAGAQRSLKGGRSWRSGTVEFEGRQGLTAAQAGGVCSPTTHSNSWQPKPSQAAACERAK
jgi:hypothetical protein